MEFTPINSQEELDALIKDRLDRERRKVEKEVRAEFNDYESIKSRLCEYETNVQSLTEKVTTLENSNSDLAAKLKASETDSAKTRIAFECGIPFEMRNRLAGETEDDIRADAENLRKFISHAPNTAPLYTPDNGSDAKDKSLAELAANLTKTF